MARKAAIRYTILTKSAAANTVMTPAISIQRVPILSSSVPAVLVQSCLEVRTIPATASRKTSSRSGPAGPAWQPRPQRQWPAEVKSEWAQPRE